MPMSLQSPTTKVIVAPGTVVSASGALGTGTTLPLAASYELFVNVSAVAGSGTLDLVMQTSPDGGTTWFNQPIRTAQLAAQGQYVIKWQPAMGAGEAATGSATAATGGALSQNCASYPLYTRFFGTIGGTSVTCGIWVLMVNPSTQTIA